MYKAKKVLDKYFPSIIPAMNLKLLFGCNTDKIQFVIYVAEEFIIANNIYWIQSYEFLDKLIISKRRFFFM